MYDDILIHLTMLADRVRTGAFAAAIARAVRPGSAVLDFGCGSGILSILAARAGARVVYAIDRSPFIRAAREIVRRSGLDNVELFHGDDTLDLPGPVDLIVSEWMGNFVFHEQMLEPLIRLRDRWLEPGGAMLPERIRLRGALVTDEGLRSELDLLRGAPYGVDFSPVADWPAHTVLARPLDTEQVLEPAFDLGELEMATCAGTPAELRGRAIPPRDATVHGVCGWFDAVLADDVGFGTGPFDPPTHWHQLVFPLGEGLAVAAGEPVEVTIRPTVAADREHTFWSWSVAAGGRTVAMDDTVHQAWIGRPLPTGKLE